MISLGKQRGDLDITAWLVWFLGILEQTLDQVMASSDITLKKTRFWREYLHAGLNPEQIKVLNRLLDGGERNTRYQIKR